VSWLVKTQEYDPKTLQLKIVPSDKTLRDKYTMIKWMDRRRNCKWSHSQMIHRYAHAIAYHNQNEIWQTCGPLLLQALKTEKKKIKVFK